MGFLPKPHHLHLVIRRKDKSRLGDSLKDNWTVLLNTVKVKKNRERLRNCYRPQETGKILN